MSKTIVLTEKQEAVLKDQANGEFSPFFSSEEDQKALAEVIEMAENLCEELNAYEEIEGDLINWFYTKYQSQ